MWCLRANGRLGGQCLGKRNEMRRVVQGLDTLQVTWITKRDWSGGKTLICRKVIYRLENELFCRTALPLWIYQWNSVDGCVGFSQAKTCHQLSFPSFQAYWKWCLSTSIDNVPARKCWRGRRPENWFPTNMNLSPVIWMPGWFHAE